jgi:DNA-directed RNA polymerase specialized sigma24 family protein
MTPEERQVWAWTRQVLHHAAVDWVREHAGPEGVVFVSLEEGEAVWAPEILESEGRLWYQDCLLRLTPRDQGVLQALAQGWRPIELAHQMSCSVRTIRRSIRRIRRQCPY